MSQKVPSISWNYPNYFWALPNVLRKKKSHGATPNKNVTKVNAIKHNHLLVQLNTGLFSWKQPRYTCRNWRKRASSLTESPFFFFLLTFSVSKDLSTAVFHSQSQVSFDFVTGRKWYQEWRTSSMKITELQNHASYFLTFFKKKKNKQKHNAFPYCPDLPWAFLLSFGQVLCRPPHPWWKIRKGLKMKSESRGGEERNPSNWQEYGLWEAQAWLKSTFTASQWILLPICHCHLGEQ